jgi:hypothetical protein
LSARLEEEWLADLRERTSGPSRLGFALGCFWASAAIGREHRPLTVPLANAARGNATVIQLPRFLSPRAVTFGLVLCLHAAVCRPPTTACPWTLVIPSRYVFR